MTPVKMKIFITGNPGSGKSTLIKKILERLRDEKVTGIITPEIREGGARQGFKIIDLASGTEQNLASLDVGRGPAVSKYRVNVAAIDLILDKFLKCFKDSQYVVIDEIGMMEFYSKRFRETIRMCLDSDKIVIATLSKRFVREYKDKGELYYLTRDNFDEIFTKILSRLRP